MQIFCAQEHSIQKNLTEPRLVNGSALITEITVSVKTDRLEAASEVKLALPSCQEDGNGGFTQLDLRNQRHLQHGTHHLRDELDFVWTCRMLRRKPVNMPGILQFIRLRSFLCVYAVHTGSVWDIFAGRCSSTGNINSLLLPRSVYLCLTTTFMYFGELCTTSISEARFPKLSKDRLSSALR